MKCLITTLSLAVALTCASAAAAQRQQKTTGTWIGCVENGTTPNTFVLNLIEPPPSSRTIAGVQDENGNLSVGTSGTSTTQRIQLSAAGRLNLSAHIGHKVEIAGMRMPSGTTVRAGDSSEMRVNVTNVRMISSNCTANSVLGTVGTSEPTLPNDSNELVPEKKY